MKSRQRISIAQTQRLQLNLGLTASIRVLNSDAEGLTRYLQEQAAENPHIQLEPATSTDWLPRWTSVLSRLAQGEGSAGGETVAAAGPSLMAHVMARIDTLYPRGPERRIAILLAEALEPTGWLGTGPDEIARQARVPSAEVEAVLAGLQKIEPAGLFARTLAECLRLQAIEAERLDSTLSCLLDHLDLVAEGALGRLARLCNTDEAGVTARLRLLRTFDPKPGAQFDPGAAPVREPDLIATKGEAGWEVSLNRSAMPTVQIRKPDKRPTTPAARAAWTQAQAVGRMIENRNATLLRVAREILARQEAALDEGPSALVALTMTEVAEALGIHESTVSRVVAGTCVDTPRGTWWLRRMFSGRLAEGGPSAAAIRAAIARLVAQEDPAAPLSDGALVEALAAEDMQLARRTVAKYREMLNIPPGHRRRRRPSRSA
ncbi:RNA polymerase factor sigma-54 [Rhodobacter sphaeroides]|jgi:RNA polymerase, sigma 54 subunit, RpoN/SigL|uniref:RNA polymerase sigma-54 factor n=2 Tax=Cereibacter sphaeroides TaxID=1063 RepID=Q3IW74_CERS4|nr:RNA polymerase factor sigma-54 [Cereibacter sphaeroides]AAF09092.1 Sigma54-2 [Cereibacter sphaeroides]ABA81210.1 RNA polymerase, sigma 54 subunit, RpoN/SigL [Cereibacter sphaeroides 2.4.1]AMJ49515.1 RNA polymerase sigma-54 factor [Cereibacter sphaeroides]ANS36227.1 RNA polymerase sigma-54 factor [Cereibacter sphaeroides]ATN65283.1 RNA polymerase sigma-54 factor [Cereibacter sphaeroides]